MIADREAQERRWLSTDRRAWEHPDELINVLRDDYVFDGFIDEYAPTFSQMQLRSAIALVESVNSYCKNVPNEIQAQDLLADPNWEDVRARAREFVLSFKGKWP
jgi:hypothetical protein